MPISKEAMIVGEIKSSSSSNKEEAAATKKIVACHLMPMKTKEEKRFVKGVMKGATACEEECIAYAGKEDWKRWKGAMENALEAIKCLNENFNTKDKFMLLMERCNCSEKDKDSLADFAFHMTEYVFCKARASATMTKGEICCDDDSRKKIHHKNRSGVVQSKSSKWKMQQEMVVSSEEDDEEEFPVQSKSPRWKKKNEVETSEEDDEEEIQVQTKSSRWKKRNVVETSGEEMDEDDEKSKSSSWQKKNDEETNEEEEDQKSSGWKRKDDETSSGEDEDDDDSSMGSEEKGMPLKYDTFVALNKEHSDSKMRISREEFKPADEEFCNFRDFKRMASKKMFRDVSDKKEKNARIKKRWEKMEKEIDCFAMEKGVICDWKVFAKKNGKYAKMQGTGIRELWGLYKETWNILLGKPMPQPQKKTQQDKLSTEISEKKRKENDDGNHESDDAKKRKLGNDKEDDRNALDAPSDTAENHDSSSSHSESSSSEEKDEDAPSDQSLRNHENHELDAGLASSLVGGP